MNNKNTCPAGEKLHAEYLLDGHCSHCHTSAPNWRDEFDEKFRGYFQRMLDEVGYHTLSDFVFKQKAQSHQQGRMEMAEEILKTKFELNVDGNLFEVINPDIVSKMVTPPTINK